MPPIIENLIHIPVISYAIHLLLASALIVVFFQIYCYITPFDEVLLIRKGNNAAALSLGGALLGFSMTVASALMHTTGPIEFLGWAAGAMLVQILAYIVTTKLLGMSQDQIEAGNTSFGGLMASISLSIGAINAACIS